MVLAVLVAVVVVVIQKHKWPMAEVVVVVETMALQIGVKRDFEDLLFRAQGNILKYRPYVLPSNMCTILNPTVCFFMHQAVSMSKSALGS